MPSSHGGSRWFKSSIAHQILCVVALVVAALPFAPAPQAHALPSCELHALTPGAHWRGTYVCSQGETQLDLGIRAVAGPHVTAEFAFDWRAGGISGRFIVEGNIDSATCALHLRPVRWIAQPVNWVMIGLDGAVSRDGSVYSGRISDTTSPACTTFRVRAP